MIQNEIGFINKCRGDYNMANKKHIIGNKNLIGSRVEEIRKEKGIKQKDLLAQLQIYGLDMNSSSLSKLESQVRCVTDKELLAIAKILDTPVSDIIGEKATDIELGNR